MQTLPAQPRNDDGAYSGSSPFAMRRGARAHVADQPRAAGTRLRPRLLMEAARHGSAHYRRERDLVRLIGPTPAAEPAALIARLREKVEMLEHDRRSGAAGYRPSYHIAVMAALMVERAVAAGAEPVAREADTTRGAALPGH